MSVVQDFRNRSEPPRKSGGLILMGIGLVLVVAAGALIGRYAHAVSWGSLAFWSSAAPSGPSFDGVRLGEARNSPLLRSCMVQFAASQGEKYNPAKGPDPALMYTALKAGNLASHFMSTKTNADASHYVAGAWALLADCIFDERVGGALCQIDNRALAVDAANSLVRLTADKLPPPQGRDARQIKNLANPQTVRERVLRTLRKRFEAGEFIAGDFGAFAHAEIRELADSTKPERNVCAK